ncbi:hypothetical protein GCM10010300_76040 [Streptomyces olivaceoviridis]|nr:hypothetical protein GCM10010300_76040 [Streptomyces olivaceoviridis]
MSAVESGRLTREALACQDIGIDEVVRAVDPPRSTRAPFYQTLFVLQDNAPPVLPFDGCTARYHRLPYLDVPSEIQTEVWPAPDGALRLAITSRGAAVAPAFARRLATTLAGLISALPWARTHDPAHRPGRGCPGTRKPPRATTRGTACSPHMVNMHPRLSKRLRREPG